MINKEFLRNGNVAKTGFLALLRVREAHDSFLCAAARKNACACGTDGCMIGNLFIFGFRTGDRMMDKRYSSAAQVWRCVALVALVALVVCGLLLLQMWEQLDAQTAKTEQAVQTQKQVVTQCRYGDRLSYPGKTIDLAGAFRAAEVVATVRVFEEVKSSAVMHKRIKYKVIDSWKGAWPGAIITVDYAFCTCYYLIQSEGLTLVYFIRDDHGELIPSICATNLHESEDGYAETISYLNKRAGRQTR
jgi:hypothetical protein